MTLRPSIQRLVRAALAVAVAGAWLGGSAGAQEAKEETVEVRELRAALKVAQDQAAAERKRADEAEAQRKALVQSLAEAVRVSEEQTAASRETELKLQALGVDLISRDGNSLEQRLLKSVRDLDIAQQEIERQSNAIRRLSESCLKVLKAAPSLDAKVRAEAESTLAAANAALAPLAKPKDGPADLSGARVVSVDSSIGLVVFDAGRPTGLRVGTPVTVLRGERPLYSALVVDVRDAIAGAVLQDRLGDSGDVEVGDGIRLLPEQNPL
jgi:hypothetical protein